MLTRVTISGADDAVEPRELLALTKAYPFVEWGVLYSVSRQGTPRHPSEHWRAEFGDLRCDALEDVPLAIHMCGEAARATLAGHGRYCCLPTGCRVQLNGYTTRNCEPDALRGMAERLEFTAFILQCRALADLESAADDAGAIGERGAVLFDVSGGTGLAPARWPTVPTGCRLGYAGGITPENVAGVLAELYRINEPRVDWWIDMESGVRTDDKFDVAKVERVLDAAAPFLGVTPAASASTG